MQRHLSPTSRYDSAWSFVMWGTNWSHVLFFVGLHDHCCKVRNNAKLHNHLFMSLQFFFLRSALALLYKTLGPVFTFLRARSMETFKPVSYGASIRQTFLSYVFLPHHRCKIRYDIKLPIHHLEIRLFLSFALSRHLTLRMWRSLPVP